MSDPDLTRNEINVGAALVRIEGKLELLAERQQSGDHALSQVIELLKNTQTFHAADLGKLTAEVKENREIAAQEATAVRLDVEHQISVNRGRLDRNETDIQAVQSDVKDIKADVRNLQLSWAKASGMAGVGGLVGALITAAAMKGLGL